MKFIIFAGGIGTRLWPLSRRNSPKQFDKIFNGCSTIEMAVERIASVFSYNDIYIQTTNNFKGIVQQQIPQLPLANIIIEPALRNIGPAVYFAIHKLQTIDYHGPMAILWADHLMDNVEEFINALKAGENLIKQNPSRFVFMGEKPRFANNNLGWIKVGKKLGQVSGVNCYKFLGWHYKPTTELCHNMFTSGNYVWNPGYFITSVDFLAKQYQKLAPQIFSAINQDNYNQAPKISFDKAIIEKIDLSQAVILKTNLGWSDPGTLYALKEALAKNTEDNVTQGQVYNLASKDCLVYNLESKKLVTTIGLKGIVVVNTKDALIVVPKDKVKHITELVEQLEQNGLEKYL